MKFIELAKQLSILDVMILNLDEKGFSDAEIASVLEITKPTIHNAKARNKTLIEALKMVESPPAEYGNHDVNTIINTFTKAFGTTKSTKWDRFAASRMAKKHGAELISGAMQALAQHSSDKFCPSVNNVSQFEEKLPSIAKFLNNKSADKEITL